MKHIRDTTQREPGEGVSDYMTRTWQLGLAEYNQTIPPLERVEAIQEQDRQARQRVGPIIEEQKDETEE